MSKGALAACQTFINHTGDGDLRKFLEDLNHNVIREEIVKTEELLKVNGVALPPGPPERPVAALEAIPPGARFNDPEISATVAKDIATGLVACS